MLASEAAPSEHEEYGCIVVVVVGGEGVMIQLAVHAVAGEASAAHIVGSAAVPGHTAVEDMAAADTIAGDSEVCEVAGSTEPVGDSRLDVPVEGRHIGIHSAVSQDRLDQAS